MKLHLNVWQRMQLIVLMSSLHGDVGLMRTASKALDVLEFSDEERDRLNIRPVTANQLQWDETVEVFELEIKDRNAASLVQQVTENHKEWSPANRQDIFDLFDQLGIKEEKKEDE